MKIIVLKGEV